jgi:hypothetical protein
MAPEMPLSLHSSLWPTKEHYLWLLRLEASHRGLLFASKDVTGLPGPYTCPEAYEQHDENISPDQWLDVSRDIKEGNPVDIWPLPENNHAKTAGSAKRRAFLDTFAWLYLEGIRENIDEKLLEAGTMKTENSCSLDSVLRDLSTLWALTIAKSPKEKNIQARIGVFSDIPQEATTIEYINVPSDMAFTKFRTQAASLGIVRHLTKKHHPALAETVFLDDSIVYHHPYPTAIDESNPSFPASIYPITRDYAAIDNGWYAHVVSEETATMFAHKHDWRPINTEEDWRSLLHLLKNSPTPQKAFLRHKSVEDRMDFIKRHREREELEVARTGGRYMNFFLHRHVDELYPPDKLEGMRRQYLEL